MMIVKLRRVGKSNVVSLPCEFEGRGYLPGASVLVEELPEGGLRLTPAEQVRERIVELVVVWSTSNQDALRILAEHDPDAA